MILTLGIGSTPDTSGRHQVRGRALPGASGMPQGIPASPEDCVWNSYPLVQGLGESLPFRNDYFDFVSNDYGLRHVPDLIQTFREYRRVLKSGGRMLLLDVSRPRSRIAFYSIRSYLGKLVPIMTRIGTGSRDAALLMKNFWTTIA